MKPHPAALAIVMTLQLAAFLFLAAIVLLGSMALAEWLADDPTMRIALAGVFVRISVVVLAARDELFSDPRG